MKLPNEITTLIPRLKMYSLMNFRSDGHGKPHFRCEEGLFLYLKFQGFILSLYAQRRSA